MRARLPRTKQLLDAVADSDAVSDEVFGFHCQQAAEKVFKAALSDMGIAFPRTHDLGSLADMLSGAGVPVPLEMERLESLTPSERYTGTTTWTNRRASTAFRHVKRFVLYAYGLRRALIRIVEDGVRDAALRRGRELSHEPIADTGLGL